MRKVVLKVWLYAVLALAIGVSMSTIALAQDTSCKTKYPFILAHGMGFEATAKYPNSFPGIAEKLRACGATVYFSTVPAYGGTRTKANAFKTELLRIKAASGAAKFNIIGHSHGGLYTRDAITNLGMASYVASLTTIDSPHRGSEIANVQNSLRQVAWLMNTILGLKPANTDLTATEQNNKELSTIYMIGTFNPNTPNKSGVYYQSVGGCYRSYKVIEGTATFTAMILAQAMGISLPSTGADAMESLYGMLPTLAGEMVFLGAGANDGLVSVNSAKWGTYLGTQMGPSGSAGVNHLDIVNLVPAGTAKVFDAPAYFVTLVKNLKAKGY